MHVLLHIYKGVYKYKKDFRNIKKKKVIIQISNVIYINHGVLENS